MTGSHERFLHNKVVNIQGCPEPTGGAGIATGGGDTTLTDLLIDGNIVDNVGGCEPGSYGDHGIYPSGPNVTITNNQISRACGWGIQQFHLTTRGVISNNTVFNNAAGGILVNAKCTQTTSDYNSVINNIVINNGTHYGIQEKYGCTGPNSVYRNNLVYGNTPTTGCSNPPPGVSGCPYDFTNGARVVTGTIQLTSSQFSSLFVNYTGDAKGDYHLGAGSVAIGVGALTSCAQGGISPCVPTTDLDGTSRLQASAYDIGAYGSNAIVSVQPPTGLTATVN
jgi:hypothetical protein